MTSYTLPPARYRQDPVAAPMDETKTRVLVVRGRHKGRAGYIKGMFARALGVLQVFVFFPPDRFAPGYVPGKEAPEVHKLPVSSIQQVFL